MKTTDTTNLPAEIVELIARHTEARKVYSDALKRSKRDRRVTIHQLQHLQSQVSHLWWAVREAYCRHGL
jgi:hypothetical protein